MYTTQDVNQAFEALAKWTAEGVSLDQEFKDIGEMLQKIESMIGGLKNDRLNLKNQLQQDLNILSSLQNKLQYLEQHGGSKTEIEDLKKQITTLESNIVTVKGALQENQNDLDNANKTEANDETVLKIIAAEINSQHGTSSTFISNQQDSNNPNRSQDSSNNPQLIAQPTAEELAAEEQAEINAYANQVAQLTKDIQEKLADLQHNKTQQDADKAEETQLEHEIIELCIAIEACGAAAGATAGISGTVMVALEAVLMYTIAKLVEVKIDENKCKDAVGKDTADIKSDFEKLKAANIGQIQNMLNSIDKLIASILPLLGKSSESGMQSAAAAVVEVLQYLQLLLAQVHEKNTENQQYMSQSSTINYQVSTDKSTTDATDFSANVRFQEVIKVTLIVTQVLLTVAALAIAIATGGAGSILLALVMASFTALNICTDGKVDVMGTVTTDLADLINKTIEKVFGKSESGLSKVAADILIAATIALIVIVTDGAGAAALAKFAGDAGEGASEGLLSSGTAVVKNTATTLEESADIEMQAMGPTSTEKVLQTVEQESSTVAKTFIADLENTAEETTTSVAQQSAKSTEETAAAGAEDATKSAVAQTLKKFALMTTMNFMMNNGLVDSNQAIWLAFKTQDQLDKDQTYQIIKIITGVLQAILMAITARYAFASAEGEQASFIQKLLGKMDAGVNFTSIAKASTVANLFGSGLQGTAAAGSAWVDYQQATIFQDLAQQQFQQVIMQSVLKTIQSSEKMDSQQFAVLIQQEAASLTGMIQKMGSAEMEAARLLLETAV